MLSMQSGATCLQASDAVAAITASKSGVGVPPNRIHQADNLAKLRQEFLSVIELIAKIFGAVSRTKA